MGEKNKLSVSIMVLLILVALSLSGTVFYFLQKEKAKSSSLEVALEDIRFKERAAQGKVEEYQGIVSGLELKLKTSQEEVDKLSVELNQEKSSKEEALNQLEQLRAELAQQKNMKEELEQRVKKEKEESQNIRNRVKELEDKRLRLEERIKELESELEQAKDRGVELGTVVVTPEIKEEEPAAEQGPALEQAAPAVSKETQKILPQEGKVLVINKDYNFVVVNLGQRDGIRIGDVFSVYSKNQYIGDIKVEKIHDSMSAAAFLSEDTKDRIKEGDKVSKKSK
ncbi:MAG: hypothetical protein JW788_04725 [Candidatus Omnitrophica bacterium]|nr:hypothetical protein [Candidatus Omnitrophota bacterium]